MTARAAGMPRALRAAAAVLIALAAMAILPGCSKEKDPAPAPFAYELADLYGTWRLTHVYVDGTGFVDITVPPYKGAIAAIIFTYKTDGTYIGDYGDLVADGPYTAEGKNVSMRGNDGKYRVLEIRSFSALEFESDMRDPDQPGKTYRYKFKKQ